MTAVVQRYGRLYGNYVRATMLGALQYRGVVIAMVVMLLSEPVVSIVVWQTVAAEAGGVVAGFTPGRFAAYYLAWMIVRQTNQMTGTGGFTDQIRRGELTPWLLRPTLPLHRWIAGVLGWATLLVVPATAIAAALSLVFRPELHTSWQQVVVFVPVFYLAALICALVAAAIGYTAFWLTSIRALDRLMWTLALLLSGRLVPVDLLPHWARTVSSVLWLRWSFDFPITVLIGPIDAGEVLVGLAMQLLWVAVLTLVVLWIWRRGVRRYGAVGG